MLIHLQAERERERPELALFDMQFAPHPHSCSVPLQETLGNGIIYETLCPLICHHICTVRVRKSNPTNHQEIDHYQMVAVAYALTWSRWKACQLRRGVVMPFETRDKGL